MYSPKEENDNDTENSGKVHIYSVFVNNVNSSIYVHTSYIPHKHLQGHFIFICIVYCLCITAHTNVHTSVQQYTCMQVYR